ncbi:hypothetical protein Ccrd_004907 [Cynara cardunculus var. scolymus]|uniref:Uncharacterized protein n=1 Tax=Cynara cardunculus var. scolymus TaxID=59895 RepID=A0A103XLR9_CYNCS|nr:hypothetical protein Ccrd_004907 [Cynara cardunculus var. scolymus]
MTPGKLLKAGEASMTVPETASPDQPCDDYVKKEHGDFIEGGSRKRHPRLQANNKVLGNLVSQNGGSVVFAAGNTGSRSGSTYTEICSSAAQHFARIREVLVERNVTSALNAGSLTPCRERLTVAVRLDLFAVNDEKFMDMFVAPGAIDILQN